MLHPELLPHGPLPLVQRFRARQQKLLLRRQPLKQAGPHASLHGSAGSPLHSANGPGHSLYYQWRTPEPISLAVQLLSVSSAKYANRVSCMPCHM